GAGTARSVDADLADIERGAIRRGAAARCVALAVYAHGAAGAWQRVGTGGAHEGRQVADLSGGTVLLAGAAGLTVIGTAADLARGAVGVRLAGSRRLDAE